MMAVVLNGCSAYDATDMTKMASNKVADKAERVEKLSAEITSYSEFQDAEYDLFNVNGFSNSRQTLPGASSWDYKFVIKVKKADLDSWTAGMTELQLNGYDVSWTKDIIKPRQENWLTITEPKLFKREEADVTVLVYEDEGVIFKRIIQH